MEKSIKENPPLFFGDNGLLMSFEKLTKVNGLGIFYLPPPALVNGLLLIFFLVRNVPISQKIVNKSVKFCFTDNNEAYFIEYIPLMDTFKD